MNFACLNIFLISLILCVSSSVFAASPVNENENEEVGSNSTVSVFYASASQTTASSEIFIPTTPREAISVVRSSVLFWSPDQVNTYAYPVRIFAADVTDLKGSFRSAFIEICSLLDSAEPECSIPDFVFMFTLLAVDGLRRVFRFSPEYYLWIFFYFKVLLFIIPDSSTFIPLASNIKIFDAILKRALCETANIFEIEAPGNEEMLKRVSGYSDVLFGVRVLSDCHEFEVCEEEAVPINPFDIENNNLTMAELEIFVEI